MLNQTETEKLAQAIIEKIGSDFIKYDKTSDILHFIKMKNKLKGSKVCRDYKGNQIRILDYDLSIRLEAGINPNGVGDGQSPAVAMTYSIGTDLHAEVKRYRHREWHYNTPMRFYGYSRSMDDIVERFAQFYNALQMYTPSQGEKPCFN